MTPILMVSISQQAMLFLHKTSEDVRAWTILVRGRWYVLSPNNTRPGGPVIFTDPAKAKRWLDWQAERGRPIMDAEIQQTLGNLSDCITTWRQLFDNLGYQPQHYAVCIINPRPAVHPAHDLDGEAIPFDSVLVPEGVVRSDEDMD